MNDAVKVSVVIAAYNRGPKIARTLDSVLAQARPPDEIVVVDDASSDGTGEWVRGHYPGIDVCVLEKNGGASLARNRGASRATGEVLVFLDSDDEMLAPCVETLVGLLHRFPQAQAAHADHTFDNPITGVFHTNHDDELPSFARLRSLPAVSGDGSGRVFGPELYYSLLHGNILQQPWAIRRTAFLALGGFDETIRLCEDWEIFIRIARRFPVALTDRVISNHLVEEGKTHMSLVAGQELWHMRTIEKHLHLAGWRDARATTILRRRLAMYYKTAGDLALPTDKGEAWRQYVRSFVAWPFDHVVAARCVLWSPAALRRATTS